MVEREETGPDLFASSLAVRSYQPEFGAISVAPHVYRRLVKYAAIYPRKDRRFIIIRLIGDDDLNRRDLGIHPSHQERAAERVGHDQARMGRHPLEHIAHFSDTDVLPPDPPL